MGGPTAWRLYQNDALINSGTMQLAGGASQQFSFPGVPDVRLEVDQVSGGLALAQAVRCRLRHLHPTAASR